MKKPVIIGIVAVAVIAVIIAVGLIVFNQAKEITIVGTWKNTELGYDFVYTFNKDGTGKYDAAGTIMEFTYNTTVDDKISILYSGSTVSFDTEYKIEGDTLNVKDSFGNDTIYKRVK